MANSPFNKCMGQCHYAFHAEIMSWGNYKQNFPLAQPPPLPAFSYLWLYFLFFYSWKTSWIDYNLLKGTTCCLIITKNLNLLYLREWQSVKMWCNFFYLVSFLISIGDLFPPVSSLSTPVSPSPWKNQKEYQCAFKI